LLVVSTAKSYKSVAELVRGRQGEARSDRRATAGIGSSTHMQLERFRLSAGIEVPAGPDERGARRAHRWCSRPRRFLFRASVPGRPQIKEGKLRALGRRRGEAKRAVPGCPHHGRGRLPSSDYNFWIGALVAAKTPRDYRGAPEQGINAAVAAPDVRERFLKLASIP